ncbi:MAG: four helix bundle protein [Gemmataceae bacterium]
MTASNTRRTFDLEERTFQFARRVRLLLKRIPRTIGNIEDGKQVLRSSGSVGANYIEANESLGNKDFLMRIKISRKEAKESHYWLRLIDLAGNQELEPERVALLQEADELTRIFGAIYRKSSS